MSEKIKSKHTPLFGCAIAGCATAGRATAGRASRVCVRTVFAAIAFLAALSGCGESIDGDESNKINGSIHVPAGKQTGSVATVNGSISIDDNAAVTSANTVNGKVQLGAHATAASLNSVNRFDPSRHGCARLR